MTVCRAHQLAGLLWVVLATSPSARSEIVYQFHHTGILDEHVPGDTALFPADRDTGTIAELTTHSITNADGSPGGELNENADSLGINSDGHGDTHDAFDGAESWTFSWDADTRLDQIRFNALWRTEAFYVKSPAWRNKAFTTDANSLLSFDADRGEFRFDDGRPDDLFDLTELVSGDTLLVSAHTPYTFSPQDGGAKIDVLTFSAASAVPEPSAAAGVLGAAAVAIAARLRRRRTTARCAET